MLFLPSSHDVIVEKVWISTTTTTTTERVSSNDLSSVSLHFAFCIVNLRAYHDHTHHFVLFMFFIFFLFFHRTCSRDTNCV